MLRQECDSEDTVRETDVAQWQLQSFSGCISEEQDTTCITNPVITATASATWHSSGCISVYPASFVSVLSLSLILIPQKLAYYLTFPLDT